MMVFNTTQSDLVEDNGMKCEVMGEIDPNTYDFEGVGVMYHINLDGGKYLQVYPDEIVARGSY